MENIFLVVKDEDGIIVPMAGIWRDNENGQFSASAYQKKNKDCSVVKVKLIELIVK